MVIFCAKYDKFITCEPLGSLATTSVFVRSPMHVFLRKLLGSPQIIVVYPAVESIATWYISPTNHFHDTTLSRLLRSDSSWQPQMHSQPLYDMLYIKPSSTTCGGRSVVWFYPTAYVCKVAIYKQLIRAYKTGILIPLCDLILPHWLTHIYKVIYWGIVDWNTALKVFFLLNKFTFKIIVRKTQLFSCDQSNTWDPCHWKNDWYSLFIGYCFHL